MFTRIFSNNLVRNISKNIFVNSNYNKIVLSQRNFSVKSYDSNSNSRKVNLSEKFKSEAGSSDPDVFGPRYGENDEEDELDQKEEEYIQNPPSKLQKLTNKQYSIMIKDLLDQKRVKEAVDVMEVEMKKSRVKPEKYIFNLLISGCAKYGYSRKAFQLFQRMKQHGMQPSGGTYSSLFNACANAPWSEDGLNKANYLRNLLSEKGYTPNHKNYNAMIKAYGRCGDIQTAFLLADEMLEKQLEMTTETFNFLLQACASDKEFGFRHALLTWHKMLRRGCAPDIYSFNLMVRCIRDCSIGDDLQSIEEVITKILSDSSRQSGNTEENKKNLEAGIVQTTEINPEKTEANSAVLVVSNKNDVTIPEYILDETPNLLSSKPHLGSLVAITEIKRPEDRLLMLGGFSGLLDEMKIYKVTPGIETFTALLEVIPSTLAAEKKLIAMIRKIGLKVDIDFFNILIKKRSMRADYESAKEVLNMIKTAKLHPDIVTYGVLALGCQTQDQARELMHEMNEKGIKINIHILGAMLKQGAYHKNFPYVHEILQICLDERVKPSEEFLKNLDIFYKQSKYLVDLRHPITKTKKFQHNFRNFKERLDIWYGEYEILGLKLEDAIKKIKERPYQQFKENYTDGFEKSKNEKFVKKQKIRKYIKKIKFNDSKDEEQNLTENSKYFLEERNKFR